MARRQHDAFSGDNVAFLALYHTAHVIVSADVRHLQIAAGAKAIFGHIVTTADRDESTTQVVRWASSPSAGHAAWHAAQMFREGLLNLRNWKANGMFHYPWCMYIGALTCWAFLRFKSSTSSSSSICHQHGAGQRYDLQKHAKTLMHQTVSVMAAASNPEHLSQVMDRCCPHGLALEVADHLKAVRWTAAFEAMKVLQDMPDMDKEYSQSL